MRVHVDESDQLSFAAVGLWHKLDRAYGRRINGLDVLTVHPDPNAWGPWDEAHDVLMPMDELMALGFAEEQDSEIVLYDEVDL